MVVIIQYSWEASRYTASQINGYETLFTGLDSKRNQMGLLLLYQSPCCVMTFLYELPDCMVRVVVESPRLMNLRNFNLLSLGEVAEAVGSS